MENNLLSHGRYRKLTSVEEVEKKSVIPTIKTLDVEDSLSQRRTTWYAGQKDEALSNDLEQKRISDSQIPRDTSCLGTSKQNLSRHSAPLLSDVSTVIDTSNLKQRQKSEPSDLNLQGTSQVRLRKKKTNNSPRRDKTVSTFGGPDTPGSSNKRSRPVSAFFTSAIMKRPQNTSTNEASSLLNTLDNKKMRMAFHDFLDSEYSSENLKFWCSCEKFKKLKTADQRLREGEHIYQQYISSRSPHQVNIDHITQRQVALSVTCGDPLPNDVFESAQRKIFHIMENDSYPRFLRSSFYREVASRRSPLESLLVGLLPGSKSSSASKLNSPTKEMAPMRNASNNNNTSVTTSKRSGFQFAKRTGVTTRSQCLLESSCPCDNLLNLSQADREAFVQRLCEPKIVRTQDM
uniref:Regulator of G-protein signaling 2-like n=1 Tax=Phallusia mammillata TaxID=59560 RepID=A0A6F9DRG4_9ASCI|nr:regulator of G-protein signaling 2-like [Phallusia mammillata]